MLVDLCCMFTVLFRGFREWSSKRIPCPDLDPRHKRVTSVGEGSLLYVTTRGPNLSLSATPVATTHRSPTNESEKLGMKGSEHVKSETINSLNLNEE